MTNPADPSYRRKSVSISLLNGFQLSPVMTIVSQSFFSKQVDGQQVRKVGMNEQQLRQHYAGQALAGILSSPRWSSTLLDMSGSDGNVERHAKQITGTLAGMAWNIAEAMIVEGRERGHIGTDSA